MDVRNFLSESEKGRAIEVRKRTTSARGTTRWVSYKKGRREGGREGRRATS